MSSQTKVCIICSTHGEFWQSPNKHLIGRGCPKCGGSQKKSTEEFIQETISVHNNKYDYTKVEYINAHTKVCIVCLIHGEFLKTPHEHLNGQGCPKCYQEGRVKWTYEKCKEVALKCSEKNFFRINYGSAYNASRKNGWLDEFFPKKK